MDYVYIVVDSDNEYMGAYASEEEAADAILDLYALNEGLHFGPVERIHYRVDDNRTELIVIDREHNQSYNKYAILEEEIKGLQ